MSKTVLFGAEVNRIQDTLFRASLQRQVVGGSQLLKVFGERMKEEAAKLGGNVLVWRGGNFRVEFNELGQSRDFGLLLTNAYQQLLDGTMTIVDPVSITNGFKTANQELSHNLSQAKRTQTTASSPAHSPTTAFCQSSGAELAAYHTLVVFGEGADEINKKPYYLSATAERKMNAGHRSKQSDRSNGFLQSVAQHLPSSYRERKWISKPEHLAGEDSERSNIAYMVADGNNMGKLFSECRTGKELTSLSDALTNAVQKAIAAPLPVFCDSFLKKDIIPLLPLILAGDDVFVMLSAPYAVHYVQQFCQAFEDEMRRHPTVQSLCTATGHPFPTMSAAVVFCKASYPYHLAHKRGEALLNSTKQVVKRVGQQKDGNWYSALSLTLIMGSELLDSYAENNSEFRANLTTYWTTDKLSLIAREATHPISVLYKHRGMLDPIKFPRKRLAQLRQLYAPTQKPHNIDSQVAWGKKLHQLKERINATDTSGQCWSELEQMLQALGAEKTVGYWKDVKRGLDEFKGHGFLDLHMAWNYLEKMEASA